MLEKKAYSRITLALDIVRKFDVGPFAGYHELNIIKHQINLYDVITIEESDTMKISCNLPYVPCDESNICWKVVDAVKHHCNHDGNVHISIEKHIPVQGGLAGGSTNAAAVFDLLNDVWHLNLKGTELYDLARTVGMDVPYYFLGGTAFDSEAGGVLEPIASSAAFDFIVVFPRFGVSTRKAYQAIDYSQINRLRDKTVMLQQALVSGKKKQAVQCMHNDFELSVFPEFPQLQKIKQDLISLGSLTSFMTGSGSTIVGVVPDLDHGKYIQKKIHHNSTLVSSQINP